MKTIAQQLNVKEFPFIIKDRNGNQIYYEDSNGFWVKREWNENGKQIYYEDSHKHWYEAEYDWKGNLVYYLNSNGEIRDYRPKPKPEYTMEQLIEKLGEDFKLVK
jgi:hypothetical protein